MGFFDRISAGLARSRDKFKESMNVLLERGPALDDEFWDTLEETLILSDVGGAAACDIVENLRDQATRKALPDAYAVLDLLNDQIAATFAEGGAEILGGDPALVLFVGINGTGKTTTVGKIAKEAADAGRSVILGSADTFRAAAIEQLEVWARRADVEMVTRERGADPASVCYDTIERAEAHRADLVLIDTAGRLHTSADLMRELEKVVNVVRKRSNLPVYTVLVIDATTGQNGLQQAREFNKALHLDALIVTKLDGTAKGGIALAVSHELGLPIIKIGVGEAIDDLRDFNAHQFSSALIGDFDERYEEEEAQAALEESSAADRAFEALEEQDGARREADEAYRAGHGFDGGAAEQAEQEAAGQRAQAASDQSAAASVLSALGQRTVDTIVVESDEEAAAQADWICRSAAQHDEAFDDEDAGEEGETIAFVPDGAEEGECALSEEAQEPEEEGDGFTDEELAELALAAVSEGDGDVSTQDEADSSEEEPRKKHFWEKWF